MIAINAMGEQINLKGSLYTINKGFSLLANTFEQMKVEQVRRAYQMKFGVIVGSQRHTITNQLAKISRALQCSISTSIGMICLHACDHP